MSEPNQAHLYVHIAPCTLYMHPFHRKTEVEEGSYPRKEIIHARMDELEIKGAGRTVCVEGLEIKRNAYTGHDE